MFKSRLALFAAVAFTSGTFALAEEVKEEAVITSRTDQVLNVGTRQGTLTINLTPSTEMRETSGMAKKKERDASCLILGLIIKVEGDLQGSTITAERIEFKQRDWRAAIATKAGGRAVRRASPGDHRRQRICDPGPSDGLFPDRQLGGRRVQGLSTLSC